LILNRLYRTDERCQDFAVLLGSLREAFRNFSSSSFRQAEGTWEASVRRPKSTEQTEDPAIRGLSGGVPNKTTVSRTVLPLGGTCPSNTASAAALDSNVLFAKTVSRVTAPRAYRFRENEGPSCRPRAREQSSRGPWTSRALRSGRCPASRLYVMIGV